MAPNFGNILSRAASEIERPKPMPVGSYNCAVKGMPKFGESAKKKTPFVEFTLSPMEAREDVDPDDLEQALTKKDGTKKLLSEMTIRATYYTTEDALYRLKDFLEHCGLDVEGDASLQELVEQTNGCQVGANIRHTASDDGAGVYANLGATFKLD